MNPEKPNFELGKNGLKIHGSPGWCLLYLCAICATISFVVYVIGGSIDASGGFGSVLTALTLIFRYRSSKSTSPINPPS